MESIWMFNYFRLNKMTVVGMLGILMTTTLFIQPATSKSENQSKSKACVKDNSGVGNNLHESNNDETLTLAYELSIPMGEDEDPYLVRIDPDNHAQMSKLEAYLIEQGITETDVTSIMESITENELEANATESDGKKKICSKNSYLDADYTNTSDLDLDSDGIPDEEEGLNDNDGDTVKNFLDCDIDGDGISDFVEAGFNIDDNEDGIPDNQNPLDTDGDGILDFEDTDSDNDGILDHKEYIKGQDGVVNHDVDGDGIPNFRDKDSDNDGLSDSVEVGSNPENPTDSDNNGIPDFLQGMYSD